jgi:hypothetical protein
MSLRDSLTDVPIVLRLRTNEAHKQSFVALCTGDVSNVESLSDGDFPNIDLYNIVQVLYLVRVSSLQVQLQRALLVAFVVQEDNYECFMADPRIRAESKAAVAACGAPAAGTFLNALPRKPAELTRRDWTRSASGMLPATVSASPTRIVSTVTSPGALAVRGQTRRLQLPPSQSTCWVVRSAPRPGGSGLVLSSLQPKLSRHNLLLPVLNDG